MSQTSVNPAGQPIAIAGQVSDTRLNDMLSRFSGESSTRIGFGLGVKPGTLDHEVKLPTANSSVIEGVTAWSANHVPGVTGDLDQTSSPPGLKPKAGMELMRQGRIWAQIDGDTVITSGITRAYCRFETDGASNTLVGTWRHSDDGHVIDTRKQAIFMSGVRVAADGTKIAELAVNFDAAP